MQLEARKSLAADEKGDELSFNDWRRSKTVEPLTEIRQSADENRRSPFPSSRSPQDFQSESVVVVLGVMYPSVLPQLIEANTRLDLIPLPPGLVTGQQSVGVVFYDPLSPSRNGYELSQTAKYQKNPEGHGHVNRAEARKAVARDLALLSLGKRR
ncbi:hypothetical protein [Pseudarthrobacter sp. NamE5]|uniref:hypothetical protein n=1 Tax=Pseudarthrobacter sp. NamE5 TaxID=2576839 RepID=UPI00110B0D78|nr:hypothetical protein [Pseudarthrobacter sp. NamE5]TLM80770.1 hypothetical protein FDW84_18120 [Pseudarthrobacter sp. NamE5]